mgnify:CR=1 FL=1
MFLYDANVDSFTVSRKDLTELKGGYAASSFGDYVVGNTIAVDGGVVFASAGLASWSAASAL